MVDMSIGSSPSVLRALNSQELLRYVREAGPSSKADIIRATGLSRPTVNVIVQELLDSGLLRPSSKRTRGGGSLLQFNKEAGLLFGIDIEANCITVLLANLTGEVIGRRAIEQVDQSSAAAIVETTKAAMQELLTERGDDYSLVKHVAFSVPAAVSPFTRTLSLIPTIPVFEGVHLASLMDLPTPVTVENDVQAAVLAESWKGVAQGRQNVAYIGLREGIGAAMLVDGKLRVGAHGMGGEVGYLPTSLETGGKNGQSPVTVEQAGGLGRFLRGCENAARAHPESSLHAILGTYGRLTVADLTTAATQQDALAIRLIDDQALLVAQAAIALVLVLDPEMLVLGGRMADLGEVFIGKIRNYLDELTPGPRTVIVRDALGGEAAAIGAIKLALQASDQLLEQGIFER